MTTTQRKRGPAPRISREAILEAARSLPDDKITMTAIGEQLGVTTPALYRYFPDKAAVLDSLALEARDQLAPPDPDLPWREWLEAYIEQSLEFARNNPDVQDDMTSHAVVVPALRSMDVGLEVLIDAGFTPVAALSAVLVVSNAVDILSTLERAATSTPRDPDLRAQRDEILDRHGLDLYPDGDLEALAELTVAMTLDGIASLLESTPTS